MDLGLCGKNALVTGASKGIGLAITRALVAEGAHEVVRQAAGEAATGRFTEPREVADLVVLLASDRAGNVTGADFVIDGGFIRTL